MSSNELYTNITYISDEDALVIYGKEYNKLGPLEKARAKELELYARTNPEFNSKLLTIDTVLYMVSSGKKPQDLTQTDTSATTHSDEGISEEEALTIFGEEYGRVGDYEKKTAKELEVYARLHPEFNRELVNMTTVLYIISSGKNPHEFTERDIKVIKWCDKHNLRNGTGPISRASNKFRKNFPMQNLHKIAVIAGGIAASLIILIKILTRYS